MLWKRKAEVPEASRKVKLAQYLAFEDYASRVLEYEFEELAEARDTYIAAAQTDVSGKAYEANEAVVKRVIAAIAAEAVDMLMMDYDEETREYVRKLRV